MLELCQKLVFDPYSNVPISVRLYEHVLMKKKQNGLITFRIVKLIIVMLNLLSIKFNLSVIIKTQIGT